MNAWRSGTNSDQREQQAPRQRTPRTAAESQSHQWAELGGQCQCRRFSQHQPLQDSSLRGRRRHHCAPAALVAFSFATTFQAIFRLSPSCVLECVGLGSLCFAFARRTPGSSARSCRTRRDTFSRSAGTMTSAAVIRDVLCLASFHEAYETSLYASTYDWICRAPSLRHALPPRFN